MLHAKAVIKDGVEAYLGSANFSNGGVEQSIELGMRVGGEQAVAIRRWAQAMVEIFDDWVEPVPPSTTSPGIVVREQQVT